MHSHELADYAGEECRRRRFLCWSLQSASQGNDRKYLVQWTERVGRAFRIRWLEFRWFTVQGATKGCVLDRPLFPVHYGKKLTFIETVSLDLHRGKKQQHSVWQMCQLWSCQNFSEDGGQLRGFTINTVHHKAFVQVRSIKCFPEPLWWKNKIKILQWDFNPCITSCLCNHEK